jgi:hypothetical protein
MYEYLLVFTLIIFFPFHSCQPMLLAYVTDEALLNKLRNKQGKQNY